MSLLATTAIFTSSLSTSVPTTAAAPAVPTVIPNVVPPVPDLATSATATATAVVSSNGLPADAVSLYQIGDLTPAIRDLALTAAIAAHVPAVAGRAFTGWLTLSSHQGVPTQASLGVGWAYPMAVTALPLAPIGALLGRDLAAIVAAGQVVLGQTTASLRGAQVGDVLSFVGPYGIILPVSVGLIVPDDVIGGTEILMSTATADYLGQVAEARVLFYGNFDHQALDNALAASGLLGNPAIGVVHSWDPPSPDNTLSLVQTKVVMGEFDFYYLGLTRSEWTAINPRWVATYVPTKDLYAHGISARCNVVIKADLAAALDEVAATLPGLFNVRTGIDVGNTNRFGGCSNNGEARFARFTTNISRHSWGQPIDMSTSANPQGGVPVMDCRIVRIFRKHNFAWGGNFLRPDGMHFEWVGTPRNNVPGATRYCPNLPGGRIQSIDRPVAQGPVAQGPVAQGPVAQGPGTVGLTGIFSHDGMSGE